MAEQSRLGAARSNLISMQLMTDLLAGSEGNEIDAMVLLENLTFGVMLMFRPDPRHAGEFLDALTMAVIERMKADG